METNNNSDWKAICAKCHEGVIEPKCEYYGEPNGCNSPIYGEHPTAEKSLEVGNAANEIAKRDALIKRLKDALSGDAAKLRMALAGLVEDCETLDQRLEEEIDGCYSIIPKYLDIMHDFRDRVKEAQAALAAPPRNCDRFATIDEARKAHEAICEKYRKCYHGCPLNNEEHYSAFDCFEAWLFAQAEGVEK